MNALLTLKQTTATPVQEGDVGIILKKDGSYEVFNTHAGFDPENMTEDQMEQGAKLLALTVALRYEAVMNVLRNMANDPAIVGQPVELGTPN